VKLFPLVGPVNLNCWCRTHIKSDPTNNETKPKNVVLFVSNKPIPH
jgi:hypothetical protein